MSLQAWHRRFGGHEPKALTPSLYPQTLDRLVQCSTAIAGPVMHIIRVQRTVNQRHGKHPYHMYSMQCDDKLLRKTYSGTTKVRGVNSALDKRHRRQHITVSAARQQAGELCTVIAAGNCCCP